MEQRDEPRRSWWQLPSQLLSCLSVDRIALLLDLFGSLRRLVKRERHAGMYESLEYDAVLELLDPQGETALFKKRQRVKFLQDHILAFQDYAWGDGEVLADYVCSPGVVVDRYREGDRWNILISLRETKNSGDVQDFYIERRDSDCYTQAEEWQQTEIRHPTRHLKLAIIFPKDRRCQRAVLSRRSRHQTEVFGQEHFADLPDGRQVLRWEAENIRHFEIFTIRWRW